MRIFRSSKGPLWIGYDVPHRAATGQEGTFDIVVQFVDTH
jgi:hypothetical protein